MDGQQVWQRGGGPIREGARKRLAIDAQPRYGKDLAGLAHPRHPRRAVHDNLSI
jgi:hypothetical protein